MTTLQFGTGTMTDFLVKLLEIPSPTGYHKEAIAYCEQAFTQLDFPDMKITETSKGALLLQIKGQRADAPVGIVAHVDTLGLMVKEIKNDGTLKATNLGGINWAGIDYENCTIRTFDDQRYRGTVMLENPSTHVNRSAGKRERNPDTMVIRIDARAENKRETEALGIGVGDFIFLDPRIEVTDTGFIRSRFLDDKAGIACIYGALTGMKAASTIPARDTYILISNYEEVGHGGAHGFPDTLNELLAVDMGALGNGQAGDEYSVSICIKDNTGPYHFDMNTKLRQLADTYEIAYKVDIFPHYGSDGSIYWRAGGGAKVGLCGPGVASSHGYERTHQDALLHTAHLLARYMLAE